MIFDTDFHDSWYLHTLGAAEQLYDALYVWQTTGSITVTSTSLAFFKALVPSVTAGTYKSGSSTYETIYNAVFTYADGFIDVVSKYAPSSGALAEQYDRNSGSPLSARDLTWSYASFLTAVARRRGAVPPSWAGGNPAATSVPGSCAATSKVGSYSTATISALPAGQTPNGSATTTSVTFTTPTATVTKTTSTGSCAQATAVAVTFTERKVTTYGQTIKIVGSIDKLGNWDTGKAVALSASQYTASNPIWTTTITFTPGQTIQYKYIVVNTDGSVTWEADPNHSYTVAKGCDTTASKSDSWQ